MYAFHNCYYPHKSVSSGNIQLYVCISQLIFTAYASHICKQKTLCMHFTTVITHTHQSHLYTDNFMYAFHNCYSPHTSVSSVNRNSVTTISLLYNVHRFPTRPRRHHTECQPTPVNKQSSPSYRVPAYTCKQTVFTIIQSASLHL